MQPFSKSVYNELECLIHGYEQPNNITFTIAVVHWLTVLQIHVLDLALFFCLLFFFCFF